MGKNKLKKFEELATYPHVFEHPMTNYGEIEFSMRGKWCEQFFKNDAPVILELGCGKGEYAVGLAKRFPQRNFIGIDIKGARIWTGATQVKNEGLENIAFLRTNIELIPFFFGKNEVDEIWITFPDPQMKKVNKRLTSTNFFKLYSEILSPKGKIHLKTDSNFLFTYTKAVVEENGLEVLACSDDLYTDNEIDQKDNPLVEIQTYYEKQWLARGIPIKYISFSLDKKENWTEPDIEIEPDPYRSFGRSARHIIK